MLIYASIDYLFAKDYLIIFDSIGKRLGKRCLNILKFCKKLLITTLTDQYSIKFSPNLETVDTNEDIVVMLNNLIEFLFIFPNTGMCTYLFL